MNMLTIMVLWTWGLTPTWVNIVGTCLIGLKILLDTTVLILEKVSD